MTRPFSGKDKIHLGYVAADGCLVCGLPAEIHHLMHALARFFAFIGRRDDRKALPFCPEHHRAGPRSIHRMGSEDKFFRYHFGHEMYGVIKMLEYCLNSPSAKVRDSLPEMVRAA